jgi:hypothetical protein
MKHSDAVLLGQSLVGKTAQSRILTMIDARGNKVLEPAQKITGYVIIEVQRQWEVMAVIGGEQVFEDLLINIK